ncbi:phosphoglucomutase/phosphomannomutase family protein [Alkaliphilus peptidifermentans]|nr:phosphoglucomutase/phosphomannomutase family protein [Alkaliphilus peptidifermentans]
MIKFGTGGWRGIIAEEFTFENVRLFAQAVAEDILEKDEESLGIVIGYDNRFMSENFAQSAGCVFAANGITVYMLHKPVPTPLVTFTTRELNTSCGLTFTASHNPAIYNGVKYTCKGGLPATVEFTSHLEDKINGLSVEQVKSISWEQAIKQNNIKIINMQHEYISDIESCLDLNLIKEKRMNVLYDPMYGTGVTCMEMLLVDSRCNLKTIHSQRDPLFGGRVPAPNRESLWRLRHMMKEGKYDVAFATDGDADRLAVIDDRGDFLHPNEIIGLLYYYFLEVKGYMGGVARNVCTTHLLDSIAKEYGYRVYETPVGFKYIGEQLLTTDAIIGGESSGGIAIRNHLLEKDGILAAGLMLEMIAIKKKKLSEIIREMKERFGYFYFSEKNYRFLPKEKNKILEYVNCLVPNEITGREVVNVNKLDGVKYCLQDNSWISIRFSGTEPYLRVMAESSTEIQTAQMIQWLEQQIKKVTILFE